MAMRVSVLQRIPFSVQITTNIANEEFGSFLTYFLGSVLWNEADNVNNGCEVSHENLAAVGQHSMLTIDSDVCVLVNQAMEVASCRRRITAMVGHDDVDH